MPQSQRQPRLFQARLSDLVPHEQVRANNKTVRALTKLLKMGYACLPIEVDPVWREHFTQGPVQMESMGFGYGILDGHHRYAAMLAVHGPQGIVEVVSPPNFEGALLPHPDQSAATSADCDPQVESPHGH